MVSEPSPGSARPQPAARAARVAPGRRDARGTRVVREVRGTSTSTGTGAAPLPTDGRAPRPSPDGRAQPFSAAVREACRDRHAEAEGTPFVRDLMGGRLPLSAYARCAEQLWYVYRALEEGAAALAGDPVAGPFLRPGLPRVPALERDLDHLLGPGWRERSAPLPATARYAGRVRSVAGSWPAGYVAHHYTRYLGDLSGGQAVRAAAERTWGFAPGGDGVRFYVFDELGSPAAFKREYRACLDALPLSARERAAFVAECREAFAMNTALLRSLG